MNERLLSDLYKMDGHVVWKIAAAEEDEVRGEKAQKAESEYDAKGGTHRGPGCATVALSAMLADRGNAGHTHTKSGAEVHTGRAGTGSVNDRWKLGRGMLRGRC
ncbi:hypothetical protein B0H19DRAFT_1062839 [Mycena capillaripes]|nr:hypothetical protein B0H19DRAFT_1062839 [Mycena capillaripes]